MGMKLLVSLLRFENQKAPVMLKTTKIEFTVILIWVSQMQVHCTLEEKGIYTSLKGELPFDNSQKLKKSRQKAAKSTLNNKKMKIGERNNLSTRHKSRLPEGEVDLKPRYCHRFF